MFEKDEQELFWLSVIEMRLFVFRNILSIKNALCVPQVLLEGETSGPHMADIGLDDISFTPGCRIATQR